MCADAGLSIDQTAKALHVTPRTVRYWISGRVSIPYAAYRLVRILGRWELPDPAWRGWIMHSGRLWSPEGHGFVPGDSNWWSLLVSQASLWRERYQRERQFELLMLRAGRAAPDPVGAAPADRAGAGADRPTGIAGRAAKPPGPNLFKGHFPTMEGKTGRLSLGEPPSQLQAGQAAQSHDAETDLPDRGDGGHAPHGDLAQAGQGKLRGHSSTLPGSSSRLDQRSSTALDGRDFQ
jgi:hypothetical protein